MRAFLQKLFIKKKHLFNWLCHVLVLAYGIWWGFFFFSVVAYEIPCSSVSKESDYSAVGLEDPLEKESATHSSILAWRIPWKEEPGGLQSMGSQESDTT